MLLRGRIDRRLNIFKGRARALYRPVQSSCISWLPWVRGRTPAPPRRNAFRRSRCPPASRPRCSPAIRSSSIPPSSPSGQGRGRSSSAVDYMTGLGDEIVRRDEIRLIEDTDGDGYADKSTVFAKGFNSIQGLAYHDGTVYVMHAPFLTALRDTERRRRGRRAPRPADRAGPAAGEEPGAAALCQRRRRRPRRLALPGPGRPRLRRPAARGRPPGAARRRHPPLPARWPRPARLRHRAAQHLRRRPR